MPAETAEQVRVQFQQRLDEFNKLLADERQARHGAEDRLSEVRDEMVVRGGATDVPGWQFALDSGMLGLIRAGRTADAKERLRKCLSSSSV